VDIRTGVASYRWQTAASVFHAISQTVGLVISGGVVKSIPFPLLFSVRPGASFPADPYPITAVDAGVESRIRLPQHRAASIGTRVLYQDQAGFTPVASWTGYGQLAVTPFVAVGAGLVVFWQSASSYATIVGQQTIPAQSSESGFVSLTVRMQSLRF
jgi:hypothetical protein